MNKIPTITLYLRKDKIKKNGKMPLYVRFPRIDNVEPKFSLGLDFAEIEWDENKKLPCDVDYCIMVKRDINRIELAIRNAVVNECEITYSLLKSIVANKNGENAENKSFNDYFGIYIKKQSELGKMEDSTAKTYFTTLNSLKEFKKDIKIREINAKLIKDFDNFLIERGKKKGKIDVIGSRYNRLKNIATIIKFIENRGDAKIENPFKRGDVIIPTPPTNPTFLDFDELEKLYYEIDNIQVGTSEFRILLMYLFSCFMGLRLGDVKNIKWKDIDFDSDPYVLVYKPHKTRNVRKENVNMPINELALSILLLSTENDIENVDSDKNIFLEIKGDINVKLRSICKGVGIEKNLSFNSSRRTLATLATSMGIKPDVLKNYLGHSSIRTADKYYKKWSTKLAAHSAIETPMFRIKDILKNNKKKGLEILKEIG